MLTSKDIEDLSSKPGVRKIAVENFLGSLSDSITKEDTLANLNLDAKQYKWNMSTIIAIRNGVNRFFSKNK